MPVREYVKHQASRPRPNDGDPDLGAYELASTVGVPVAANGALRLLVVPNPVADACEIRLAGIMGPTASGGGVLQVIDVHGRRVARLAPITSGRWRWTPAPTLGEGVYFVRAGSLVERIVLLR